MTHKSIIGGIAMISGTAIGAGMLALPIQTAKIGFINSSLLFVVCWFFMTISALYLLEANLQNSKPNTNLLSMAQDSLGSIGKFIAVSAYLILLYALTAAYLSGLSNWFVELIAQLTAIKIPHLIINLSIAIFISTLAYIGTHSMDYANRLLVIGLCVTFTLLFLGAICTIELNNLLPAKHHTFSFASLPLIITSFGYHIVIPSLTTYYKRNVPILRKAILIGSTIPLFIYIIWEAMILGVLPLDGANGINTIINNGNTTVGITVSLAAITQNTWITEVSKALIFFAIITSVIGVSMSLFDFLADGLKTTIHKKNIVFLALIVFALPIYFVLHHPYTFNLLLSFGGIFVAVLLGVLPALMAYSGRRKGIKSPYTVSGGNALLWLTVIFFISIIGIEIANELHLIL